MTLFPNSVCRRVCAALLALTSSMPALPCTTFVIDGDSGPLFGRNYDFEFVEDVILARPAAGVGSARC